MFLTSLFIIWIAFNALYASQRGTERDCIKLYIQANIRPANVSLCQNILDDATYFKIPIYDCRKNHTNENTQEHIDVFTDESQSIEERITALVLCVYQARCNLFHGDKIYDSKRDIEVSKHSAKVLKALLLIFLKER